MSKLSKYLQSSDDRPSSARLMMFCGLCMSFVCCLATVVCWIWTNSAPNGWLFAICAIPVVGGIVPYCIQVWRNNSNAVNELIKTIRGKESE